MYGFGPDQVLIIALAMALGGLVKGTIGIGLPVVCVAILSNFFPVTLVLGLVIVPIALTNLWQAVHAGNPMEPIRRFWPMIVCLLITIYLTAKLVVRIDEALLYGLIGIAVMIFSATSLIRPSRGLSPATERWAGPLAGTLGGILGGISTMWGPPMMMYFVMLGLPKEAFIRAVGLVWFAGSIPLVIGYIENGILNGTTAQISALACLPGFLGLWLGTVLRRYIPQEIFRKVLLLALFVVGLNLIRRALV
ncbi:MAG: sulfite exporter TauE/SafE family protein [Pseudomonadota bacterium]